MRVTRHRPSLAVGSSAKRDFEAAQARQGQERDREEPERRDEDPVERPALGREPADERAGDLPEREEHAVEPHDRPSIVGEGLGHVREEAERGGRRARQHEEPGRRGR